MAQVNRPTPEVLAKLTAIVGEANAVTSDRELEPHLREWRGRFAGATPMMLRPASTLEVGEILRVADEARVAIVPQGGNTGLAGGQIPSPDGTEIILNLSRMNKIREACKAANTLIAEAGVPLKAVQEAAAAAGRMFPLSLASEGSCQTGGVLATNAGGIHVVRYGTARDLTLGLEAVFAGGRVWHGLKSLRKDNTGYDLKNLLIGSEGTLAVITAACLKLVPRPAEVTTVFAGLPDIAAVEALFALAFECAGSLLTAFELIPRLGIDFVLTHTAGARDPLAAKHPWYALAEVSSPLPEDIAQRITVSVLADALEDAMVTDAAVATSHAQAAQLWLLRERLSEAQRYAGATIEHDVSLPAGAIGAFVEAAGRAVEHLVPGARPVPFGHFGDGNIHYNVSQPAGSGCAAFLARRDGITDAIHGIVLALGGSISAEHGIGQLKVAALETAKSRVELDIMRAIKAALDPQGILNPGKVLRMRHDK